MNTIFGKIMSVLKTKTLQYKELPASIQRLADIIGIDAATLVWREYSGTNISVPVYVRKFAGLKDRDAGIRLRYHAGEKAAILAAEFRITERRVFQIIEKGEPNS